MSFLTVEEVAKRFRVSKMTVYRAVESGELRSIKVGKRTVRIPEDAVEEWVSDGG